MLKKLRRRFVLINMAIVTGMLLIIFGLVIHFTNARLDSQSDAMLQSIAQNALDPEGREPNAQLPYFTLRFDVFGKVVASGKTHYKITDRDFLDKLIDEIFIPLISIEFENTINKHCNGGIINMSHYSYFGILVGNDSAEMHIKFLKENMGINNVTFLTVGDLK